MTLLSGHTTEEERHTLTSLFLYIRETAPRSDLFRYRGDSYMHRKFEASHDWKFDLGGCPVLVTEMSPYNVVPGYGATIYGRQFYVIETPDWSVEFSWSNEQRQERDGFPTTFWCVDFEKAIAAFHRDMIYAKMLDVF
jgi:hypothetical protein